ncbi:hypothetical protein GUJ93_ZPchr0013g37972 [Zizania palustris]|uniref:Uncharacterized protein n=1 Tax=Zizania palustris TaxID=103762 RepID=A0A8J5WSZ0_ZIZPA|nr:hypothetical protein GUJ93_ZPchr0013g37972 [Zizania palustris]
MRRSLSLDSCANKHLYLAFQQQQHSAPLGKPGESSAGAVSVAGRKQLRRSFFSLSHGRRSSPTPTPNLPITSSDTH